MSERILIRFFINKEPKFTKKYNINEKLSEIRKLLNEKLPTDSLFTLSDGCEIDIEDENDYQLSEIIDEGKVYIKSNLPNTSLNTKAPSNKNIPIEGSKLISKKGKLDIYLYPKIELNEDEKEKAISFMVLGQTGCGKTTIINSFLNYILGIKIEDNFRYELVHMEDGKFNYESQTSNVEVYNLKGIHGLPPFQIIDTPGFGNTKGINQDLIIPNQIEKVFKEEINNLNAICLVAKSSNARLTVDQKYIFTSILNLFDEDMKKNFIALLTFCDGGIPQIVDALEDSNSVLSKLIPCLNKPWYLKFNNSAIFEDNLEETFTKMFFTMNMKSFEEFKQRLVRMPKKSLNQTKQVLEERNKLEKYGEILTNKLSEGRDKVNYIKDLLETISTLKRDLNNSKNIPKSYLDTKIQLLKGAKNELINIYNECIITQDLIIKSINRLKQIALIKNYFELLEEYIELLIEYENNYKISGFKTRIEQLEHLKQQKIILKEIYKGENKKMNYIKQFIENRLNEENI